VARSCFFCDGEVPDDAPPEHVIPQWTQKFRPKGTVFQHIFDPAHRPNFKAKKVDVTADTVCPRCNHGWMSDLETHASPLLTPMIEGKPQGLDIKQQALISQWVAKTVLTWDQSQPPERRMYPVAFCRWLYEHRLPPPGSCIRLGQYRGTAAAEFVEMYNAMYLEVPADPADRGLPETHRATIRIGQLITELTITKDASAVIRAIGANIDDLLLTIWPSVEIVSWTPRVVFDDASLRSLVRPGPAVRSP
jgi:hypothetical protein